MVATEFHRREEKPEEGRLVEASSARVYKTAKNISNKARVSATQAQELVTFDQGVRITPGTSDRYR